MEDVFTAEGAWGLTFYEFLIELGASSDAHVIRALERLWQHPALDGPYAEQTREPRDQPRVDPSVFLGDEQERKGRSYGVLTLNDGARVACGTWLWRRAPGDAGGGVHEVGTDWLELHVPLGSLSRVWPEVAPFPFLDGPEDEARHAGWQERIETLFVDIARHVFAELPFDLAVIGHEFEMLEEDFEHWEQSKREIPADHDGLLLASDGELTWNPPTRRGGWILITDGLGNPSTWGELFSSSPDDES